MASLRRTVKQAPALVGPSVRGNLRASLINSQALTPLLLLAGASLFIPFWAAMRFGAAAARISAALWPAINLGALLLFDFSSMVLSRAVGEAAAAVVATVAYALMLVHLAALVVPRLR